MIARPRPQKPGFTAFQDVDKAEIETCFLLGS